MKKFKNFLRNLQIILNNIGIDLLKLKKIIYISKYINDYLIFKKLKGRIDFFLPILGEHKENNSNFDKHYFYQETTVSSYIFNDNPNKHVDVGSRLSGFIGNVASYRKIEFFDLRPANINHNNIVFKNLDLLNLNDEYSNYTDSLSCLYVLEHIGLGRYGDRVNPSGSKIGYDNLIKMLKSKGKLYIAIPIANKSKTYFNAHKVFEPSEIINWNTNVTLDKFDYVDDNGKYHNNKSLNDSELHNLNYGCGIYTFIKN